MLHNIYPFNLCNIIIALCDFSHRSAARYLVYSNCQEG
nr:MAG TPA: hypothetical protein [Caudoviricetes sp.]